MKISPSVLLKIRNEFNPPYFAAVMSWQKDPTDSNKQLIINTLNAYCQNITKSCTEKIGSFEYTIELICGSFDNPTKSLLLALVELPILLVSIYHPLASPLVALGPLGFCVYHWAATREKNYEIEIPFKTHFGKSRLDVNIPLQKN
jgi:hypothetical protein